MDTHSNNVKSLWEILVPTVRNCGTPFRLRYHRVWDEKVRAISGGLTIVSPIKGQWQGPDGVLYNERMIPVRIIATREQIKHIVAMTITYYDQLTVLAYKVADDYILMTKEEIDDAKNSNGVRSKA